MPTRIPARIFAVLVLAAALLFMNLGFMGEARAADFPPLHQAAFDNDVEKIRQLIAGGANVNATREVLYPEVGIALSAEAPLHTAAHKDSLEAAELLIVSGASVDVRTKPIGEPGSQVAKGFVAQTPLHRAAAHSYDVAELLIAHGANVNAKSKPLPGRPVGTYAPIDITPLHLAAGFNLYRIAELFIANGADVNAKVRQNTGNFFGATHEYLTPLEYARKLDKVGKEYNTGEDYSDVLNLLTNGLAAAQALPKVERATVAELRVKLGLDKPANEAVATKANAASSRTFTPLHQAAKDSDVEKVRKLIAEGAPVNMKDNRGATPLHWSAWGNASGVASLLLANGAEVNAKNNNGQTPLHEAAWKKASDVVSLLLANGADAHAKNNDGKTPLNVARGRGSRDVIELLTTGLAAAQSGPKIQLASPPPKSTLLHNAAREGAAGAIPLLLKKGMDINAKGDGGKTPLHVAIENRGVKAAMLLIENAADINAKDAKGATPLDYAHENKVAAVVKLLEGMDAKTGDDLDELSTLLHDAVREGEAEAIPFLLKNGEDINAKAGKGRTPLHLAIKKGSVTMALVLIKNKANIDEQDEDRMTPLDYARKYDVAEMAEFLENVGASTGRQLEEFRREREKQLAALRKAREEEQAAIKKEEEERQAAVRRAREEERKAEEARQAAAEQARREAEAKSDAATFGTIFGLGAGYVAGREVYKDSGNVVRSVETGMEVMEGVQEITAGDGGGVTKVLGGASDALAARTSRKRREEAEASRARIEAKLEELQRQQRAQTDAAAQAARTAAQRAAQERVRASLANMKDDYRGGGGSSGSNSGVGSQAAAGSSGSNSGGGSQAAARESSAVAVKSRENIVPPNANSCVTPKLEQFGEIWELRIQNTCGGVIEVSANGDIECSKFPLFLTGYGPVTPLFPGSWHTVASTPFCELGETPAWKLEHGACASPCKGVVQNGSPACRCPN